MTLRVLKQAYNFENVNVESVFRPKKITVREINNSDSKHGDTWKKI